MGTMASQITSLTTVYSTVYSGANQRKHQSSVSLAFMRGIHRGPVNSPHMASNAETVSIWWRHHDFIGLDEYMHEIEAVVETINTKGNCTAFISGNVKTLIYFFCLSFLVTTEEILKGSVY